MENVEPSPASPVPSDEEPPGKSFIEKLKSVLGFRGAPDTTEELEHEIQELLEEGEEQGLISVHEEQLINSIFDFRETIASEIMTPSAEMVCADIQSSVPELIRLVIEEGYTIREISKAEGDAPAAGKKGMDGLKRLSGDL